MWRHKSKNSSRESAQNIKTFVEFKCIRLFSYFKVFINQRPHIWHQDHPKSMSENISKLHFSETLHKFTILQTSSFAQKMNTFGEFFAKCWTFLLCVVYNFLYFLSLSLSFCESLNWIVKGIIWVHSSFRHRSCFTTTWLWLVLCVLSPHFSRLKVCKIHRWNVGENESYQRLLLHFFFVLFKVTYEKEKKKHVSSSELSRKHFWLPTQHLVEKNDQERENGMKKKTHETRRTTKKRRQKCAKGEK